MGAIGRFSFGSDSGKSNCQSGNVSNGVEIGSTVAVMNPQSLLPGSLKTGVVILTFGMDSVGSLEGKAVMINGRTIFIRNGDVLGTVASFLAVVPVLVITGVRKKVWIDGKYSRISDESFHSFSWQDRRDR